MQTKIDDFPFQYVEWLEYDSEKLLELVTSIPETLWRGQGPGEYTADNPLNKRPAHEYGMNTALNLDHDYDQYPVIQDLKKQLMLGGQCLYYTINWKRSKKDYFSDWNTMMNNETQNKRFKIERTFDIVVPVVGDFRENPVEAKRVSTGEEFVYEPKGTAMAIQTSSDWHYRWCEEGNPYRYTLHLRSRKPVTWRLLEQISNEKRNKHANK